MKRATTLGLLFYGWTLGWVYNFVAIFTGFPYLTLPIGASNGVVALTAGGLSFSLVMVGVILAVLYKREQRRADQSSQVRCMSE